MLVLDDELMVGRALQRLLGPRCDVHVLDQGTTALARVAAGQRFDAILCDLLMPQMDGPLFYEMLLQLAPEEAGRVIFMTGGALTDCLRAFISHTGRPCLDKPIEPPRLRALLAALPPLTAPPRPEHVDTRNISVYSVYMNDDLLLRLLSPLVLLGWAAMVFAPRARVTKWVLESDVVPLVIGAVYLAKVAPHLPGVLGMFDTLPHIEAALRLPGMLLAGWIHYLAFDFLVGRVMLADAQRRGVPHLLVVPCLLMTFMLGPSGYLAYAGVRLITRRFWPAVAPVPVPAASPSAP